MQNIYSIVRFHHLKKILFTKNFSPYSSQIIGRDGASLHRNSQLDKELQSQLSNSYSMKNLMEIYKNNQQHFNPFNVYFIIREVQSRYYTEDPKALLQNTTYKELFEFIQQNLNEMPAYTLVEVLTLVRKGFQNGHLESKKAVEIANKINYLLNGFKNSKKNTLNPKLISQAFLDLCHLDLHRDEWIDLTKVWIEDVNLSTYFTSHTIFNYFRASEIYYKKKHSDFYYSLSVKAINVLPNLDLDRQCVLFRAISSLQLQFTTSHTRLPQVLIALKDNIIKKLSQDFTAVQGLNIIAAFSKAPHSLESQLLDKVMTQMMQYIQRNQLSLRQTLSFFSLTSHLREGYKLTREKQEIVISQIGMQLQASKKVSPSLLLAILDSMQEQDYFDTQILKQIESCLATIENREPIGFTLHLKILKGMLKSLYDAKDMRKYFFDKFQSSVFPQPFEMAMEVIYILNYQMQQHQNDHLQYEETVNKLISLVCEQIKNSNSKQSFLFILNSFGKKYSAQKSKAFSTISNQFFETYKVFYPKFDNNDISSTFMNICNWNLFGTYWQDFILSQIKNTTNKELVSWILQKYINDQNKIYPKVDVMLACCVLPQIEQNFLLQVKIRCLLTSPYQSMLNKKGSSHPSLAKMFSSIDPSKINFKESKINSSMLIKAQRNWKLLKVKSNFLVNSVLMEFIQNKDMHFREKGEFNCAEIGSFLIQYEKQLSEQEGLGALQVQAIRDIKKFLDQKFEVSNQDFGFSLLFKYTEIAAYISEIEGNSAEGGELEFLVRLLIQKMQSQERSENQGNQMLNAILLLASQHGQNKIELDFFNQEYLFNQFQKALSSISISALVSYLDEIKQLRYLRKINPTQQDKTILSKYLTQIEYFYLSQIIGKLPYVVVEFLQYFSDLKKFYSRPAVYNKLLQDILNLFPRLKVGNIQEIVNCMGNLKLHHKQVLNLIFNEYQTKPQYYKSSYQDLILTFAKLGYQLNQEQKLFLAQFLSSHIEDKIFSPIKMLWAVIYFDLQNETFFEKLLSSALEANINESEIQYLRDVIIYFNLTKSQQPQILSILQAKLEQFNMIQRGEEASTNDNLSIPNEINQILYEGRGEINKQFECGLIGDIYDQESNQIILIQQLSLVCHDYQTPSGFGELQRRFYTMLQNNQQLPKLKIIFLNGWKYSNAGNSIEEKKAFVQREIKQ